MNIKTIIPTVIAVLLFTQCGNKQETENTKTQKEIAKTPTKNGYLIFGDLGISDQGAISNKEMGAIYQTMEVGDTIEVKFSTTIKNICQKKGCWMNVELADDKTAFIRFKDYGFFAPMNYAGADAIIDGKAFVKVTSIKELQHYAKDAKKSQEEIDAITEPKRTLSFLASGIMLKKNEK